MPKSFNKDSTNIMLPIALDDATILAAQLDPGAKDPEHMFVILADIGEQESVRPVEVEGVLNRVSSEFVPFTVITQRYRDLVDDDDNFIGTAIELDSAEINSIYQRLVEALSNIGINLPEDSFSSILLVSEKEISHDRSALNMSLRVANIEIHYGMSSKVDFLLGEKVEASFFVASNVELCGEELPFALISEETGEALSCHGTVEEAEEALETLLVEQSTNSDEILINLSTDDKGVFDMTQNVSHCNITEEGDYEIHYDNGSVLTVPEAFYSSELFSPENQAEFTIGDTIDPNLVLPEIPTTPIYTTDRSYEITVGTGTAGTVTFNGGNTIMADRVGHELAHGHDEEDMELEFDAKGPIVLEGVETGDKRIITAGSLVTRPGVGLPFMYQPKNMGHDRAMISGSIVDVQREISQNDNFATDTDMMINEMVGFIKFGTHDAGNEAREMLESGLMRGVSVDLDLVEVEIEMDDDADLMDVLFGGAGRMRLTSGRIMGATFLPFPAFAEAQIEMVPSENALVASGVAEDKLYIPQMRFNMPLEAL